MLSRIAVVCTVVSALCFSVCAQDWTTKNFSAPANDVYQVAVKVIALHHEIKSKDPEIRVVRFHIGTTAWSWGYNVGLSVEPQSDHSSIVKVAIEKSGGPAFSWGSGKKEILKIYRYMDDELTSQKVDERTAK